MKTYEELVKEYKKRQHDTVVDTIATGLTYVDEIAVDTGILEETGILTELTQSVTGFLPFAIISATEGTKVLLGKKPAWPETGQNRTEGRRFPDGKERCSDGRRSRRFRAYRILGSYSGYDGCPGTL